MSRINGEKARANITKRRRTQQRVKDAAAREGLSGSAQSEKPGGRPMAARAAKRGASGK